ncbi:MAG: WYL domain-containing protein [Proteobacteria bacterium]|nr:WYL domain-containing protein [Pseudomonadota bacterium]
MNELHLQALNQTLRERLAFIEFRLWFLGDVRRPDLIDRFGIAPAVATRDLGAYRELAPGNIAFEGRRKTYIPTPTFRPVFEHDPERVLSALSRGFGEGIGKASGGFLTCEFPLRLNRPPLEVLAVITRAIHQQRVVRLIYHSLNKGPSERVIVPYALVDSGLRWHARVYDRVSREFRDLVITRMEAPELLEDRAAPDECADRDIQWNRIVRLALVPHPGQPRPEIVARDFGMANGDALTLNVRAAIAGYVLQQWGVDCSPDHSLDSSRYRLWLKDPLVLYGVENALLAPGYRVPA